MSASQVRYAMIFINLYVVSANKVLVAYSAVFFATSALSRVVSLGQDTSTKIKSIVAWAMSNLCVMNVFIAPLTILP